MKTKLATHPFERDWTVAADHNGEPFCTCGVPKRHPRHILPDVPEQAAHRARFGDRDQ